MSREQVVRNQRTRIYGAMIESVTQRGFQRTAVADLIALAGVSRRAFYEHFRDKRECLFATHNNVVGSAQRDVVSAWASERGWSNRLHSACRRLFEEAATQPKHAHFVLVDSLGTMPGARERLQLSNAAFERPLRLALQARAGDRSRPSISATAITGGIRHLLFSHVSEGNATELATLPEEVLDWIECYRASTAASLLARPSSSPVPVRDEDRPGDARERRVMEAMLYLTSQAGYAAITDSQLAKSARISTHAFHKIYADKEACFLALRDRLTRMVLDAAREEMQDADSWPERVHRGMNALVSVLALHPATSRLTFVDVFDTGSAAIRQTGHPVVELANQLAEGAPRPRYAPRVAHELVAGAITAIVAAHAANDQIPRLPRAVDWLAFLFLAPHIGATTALDEIACAGHRRSPPSIDAMAT
jgi:AcrR family transcriptional regulator